MNAAPIRKLVAAIGAYLRDHAETLAMIRKFVVAIGVGLTLASLRLNVLKAGVSPTYWRDRSVGIFIVVLVVLGALLLVANVLLLNDRFLTATSAIGAVLLGFFLFIPLTLGFGHIGDLDVGAWFALAGSATIAFGAAPYRALASWSKEPARPDWSLYGSWLVAALAFGLVMFSLPLALSSREVGDRLGHVQHPSFWNSAGVITGRHTLGIAMIVLAAIAIASLLGAALVRARLFGAWAVAAALVLLGVALYYPMHLAINELSVLESGSGLALEGALLAVGATAIAVLSQRGIVRLNRSALRQLVALVGLGLALAGTWARTFTLIRGSYWGDGTLGGFPTLLIGIGAALVVASFVTRRWWVLPAVGALGWVVAGFFAFDLIGVIPNTGRLGSATWLGVGGGVLAGLSAVSLRMLSHWQRSPLNVTLRRAAVWAVTGTGLGLLLVSLWLDTQEAYVVSGKTLRSTYWDTGGDRSLGIAMLVLGVSAVVALAGFAFARIPALGAWTLAASLALLGITVRLPVELAFNHLGFLRSGGWLALVGAVLASAGATAMVVLDWPFERTQQQEETKGETAHSQGRVAPKGKQRRVPGTRRAR